MSFVKNFDSSGLNLGLRLFFLLWVYGSFLFYFLASSVTDILDVLNNLGLFLTSFIEGAFEMSSLEVEISLDIIQSENILIIYRERQKCNL